MLKFSSMPKSLASISLIVYLFKRTKIKFEIHFLFLFYSGNRMEQLGTPYKKGKPCSGCLQSCHSKKIRYVINHTHTHSVNQIKC